LKPYRQLEPLLFKLKIYNCFLLLALSLVDKLLQLFLLILQLEQCLGTLVSKGPAESFF
jgi:hypothetical protein